MPSVHQAQSRDFPGPSRNSLPFCGRGLRDWRFFFCEGVNFSNQCVDILPISCWWTVDGRSERSTNIKRMLIVQRWKSAVELFSFQISSSVGFPEIMEFISYTCLLIAEYHTRKTYVGKSRNFWQSKQRSHCQTLFNDYFICSQHDFINCCYVKKTLMMSQSRFFLHPAEVFFCQ